MSYLENFEFNSDHIVYSCIPRFVIERSYLEGSEIKRDVIDCKLTGIRKPRSGPELPRPEFDGSDNDIQWVEISGCQYAISEGELLC